MLNPLNILLEALRAGCCGQMRKLRFGQRRFSSHSAKSPLPSLTPVLTETLQDIVSLPSEWLGFVFVSVGDTLNVPAWLLLSLSHLKHLGFLSDPPCCAAWILGCSSTTGGGWVRVGEVGWLRRGERPRATQGQECGDIELKTMSHSQHENQALCIHICIQWIKQNARHAALCAT